MRRTSEILFTLTALILVCDRTIPSAVAGIPEPPILIYGHLANQAGTELSGGDLRFDFTPSGGGAPLSFSVAPSVLKPGVNFLVRVTLEHGGVEAGVNALESGKQYIPTIFYNNSQITSDQFSASFSAERALVIGPLSLVVGAVGPTPTPGQTNPTVTPTPTITPTPGSNSEPPQPVVVYEFDQSSLPGNRWVEVQGGFSDLPPGAIGFTDYSNDPSMIPGTADHKGMVLNVLPGSVAFAHALEPIVTNGKSVLMRMTARASSANASVWLVGLKGSLQTGVGVDGSLVLNNPVSTAGMQSSDQQIVLFYKPESASEVVTPVIQVAGNGSGFGTTVLVDKLEVYLIDTLTAYPCALLGLKRNNNGSLLTEGAPQSAHVFEFDQASLAENSWAEIPGGFIEAEPGSGFALDFSSLGSAIIPSSRDRKGYAVVVNPNQVTFAFSAVPVNVNEGPVLLRMSVQSDSPDASLWLVGLRGDLAGNKDVDGSLSYSNPISTANLVGKEGNLVVLYEPDGSRFLTPAFQVAGKSGTQTTVLIDRIEVFQLESNKSYLGSFLSE